MDDLKTLKKMLESGYLKPNSSIECRAKRGGQNHVAILRSDGSVEEKGERAARFDSPQEWAASLGHQSPYEGRRHVKVMGGYSLGDEQDRYLDNLPSEEDGVESEDEGDAPIRKPFDPEKIQVLHKQLVIGQLVTRMENKEIIRPEFQRKEGIWDRQRKSRLIESLLLRIPIPVFYFSADSNDDWSVVDGLQRTTSIFEFVSGASFKLKGLEYLRDFEGMTYGDLPRNMQRRIDETELSVNVIQPGTPGEVTFNIFSRINTGGMQLTRQEIRHALHSQGPVLKYLKRLAETEDFLKATQRSVRSSRLADQECVLRFLSFYPRRWQEYGVSDDLDPWLNRTMERINRTNSEEREWMETAFRDAMRTAHRLFGDYAFRKRSSLQDRKRPINKALFEVWGVGLARLSPDQRVRLASNRKAVQEGLFRLMGDQDYVAAISNTTGDYKRVKTRFGRVDDLIRECLA